MFDEIKGSELLHHKQTVPEELNKFNWMANQKFKFVPSRQFFYVIIPSPNGISLYFIRNPL